MTILGYLMLPIALAGLLVSRQWLYRSFVFWTLFSASSAANFGTGESGSALQIWMLFGSCWLLRLILDAQLGLSATSDRRILMPCLWLGIFIAIATLSLVMPLYINGSLMITSPVLFDGSQTPLFFTAHNVTQLLYLIFGCAIAVAVAHVNLADTQRHETERIILLSAVAISLWGLLQFVCNLTGIPYPDFIFNNSSSISAKGYLETLNGMGRISSAAVEPSIFAQGLIAVLPLTLPAWLRKGRIISTNFDRACSLLFVLLLVLSTSSTAYLGIFVIGVLSVPVLLRTKALTKGKTLRVVLGSAFAFALILGAAVLFVPLIRDVLTSAILQKAVSGSGMERVLTIALAFGYFQKFPLLGIGWGSATSHDLLVKLLSNVGVLGTLAFLAAMFSVIRRNWRSLEPLVLPISLSRAGWFLGFSAFLVTSVISGFPLALGNFWLFLGMAISTSWSQSTERVQVVHHA